MIDKKSILETLFTVTNSKTMINHYFNNLRVEFDCILLKNGEKLKDNSTVKKIEEAFENATNNNSYHKNWVTAYKIENYLTHISDEDTLDTDLKRYILIYKKHFPQQDYDYFEKEKNNLFEKEAIRKLEEKCSLLDEKRSLLLRLQSELHAFYLKRSEQRKLARLSRIRTAFIFLAGVAAFLLSLLYCFFSEHSPSSDMIVVVIATGFFGASFSMLINLRTQLASASLEDLKVLHRQEYISARSCIGIGAALFIYFLIQSNFMGTIVSENLIPDLPVTDDSTDSYRNISLLIIWSFLAGFSEMLVPNLLTGIERRVANKN